MTIDDITALIASDESRTLELKKSTGELKDGMHAACVPEYGGWFADFRYYNLLNSIAIYDDRVEILKKPFLQYFSSLELAYDSK